MTRHPLSGFTVVIICNTDPKRRPYIIEDSELPNCQSLPIRDFVQYFAIYGVIDESSFFLTTCTLQHTRVPHSVTGLISIGTLVIIYKSLHIAVNPRLITCTDRCHLESRG